MSHQALRGLAAEAGVPLDGFDEDALAILGVRLVAECIDIHDGHHPFVCLGRIADEVRRNEVNEEGITSVGQTGDREQVPDPVDGAVSGTPFARSNRAPSAHRPRYLATEATTRRVKDRLASVHRIEDARSGLLLFPRRPQKPLDPQQAHEACITAYADDGYVCSRCKPILHPAVCDCDVCDAWWAVQQ